MTNPGFPGSTPPPPPNYPPPKGGMPKWLIILLVVLLIILVGCCGDLITCYYAGRSLVRKGMEQSGMSFTGTLPASFPGDVPVYSGFTPTFSVAPPGSDAGEALFSGKEDPAKVGEFYDKELTAGGWTKTTEQKLGGGITQVYTKDTRELSISIHGNKDDANLSIGWHKKGSTGPGGGPPDTEENAAPARPAGGGGAGGGGAARTIEGNSVARTDALPGSKMPANFPTDVPVYTGLTPGFSFADKTAGSGSVMLSGKVEKEKVAAFYEKELEKAGWKQQQNQDFGAGTLMTYSKEKRNLTVQIVPDGDKTTVTLAYQKE